MSHITHLKTFTTFCLLYQSSLINCQCQKLGSGQLRLQSSYNFNILINWKSNDRFPGHYPTNPTTIIKNGLSDLGWLLGVNAAFITGTKVFMAASRTRLAVTSLPYIYEKNEALDLLLSIPTHTWAVANKDKLSNKRQLLEDSICLQLGCSNRTDR